MTFVDDPAENEVRTVVREKDSTPVDPPHCAVTLLPARLNTLLAVPPPRKEMFRLSAEVDVPARPDIVIEGVHRGRRGMVLIRAIVIWFESHGNGEL